MTDSAYLVRVKDIIEEAKELLAARTPGEWIRDDERGNFWVGDEYGDRTGVINASVYPGEEGKVFVGDGDAAFILRAARMIEALVAEVERLRLDREELSGAWHEATGAHDPDDARRVIADLRDEAANARADSAERRHAAVLALPYLNEEQVARAIRDELPASAAFDGYEHSSLGKESM